MILIKKRENGMSLELLVANIGHGGNAVHPTEYIVCTAK